MDIDELERLIKASNQPAQPVSGATALALIAEVRALRETLSHPIAWRCDWDGRDGTGVWHQYHDAEDPLPEAWDDEVPVITPLYAARGAK